MREFALKFYKRLEKTPCRFGNFTFTTIAVANYSRFKLLDKHYTREENHANIILVMKDSNTKIIRFMLYDPHGYKSTTIQTHLIKKSSREFIRLLKFHVEKIYQHSGTPYTIEILDEKIVSCPLGIQENIMDRLGYCDIITMFWLYLVLGLFSSPDLDPQEKIYLFNNLKMVETSFYNSYYDDVQSRYNTVINFGFIIINKLLGRHPKIRGVILDEFINLVKESKHSSSLKIEKKLL